MKHAKASVAAIHLYCPHCGAIHSHSEGIMHTDCVASEPGIATCDDCGERFAVPLLWNALGRQVRFSKDEIAAGMGGPNLD